MAFRHSRGYVGYLTALCMAITVMVGYASADDKQTVTASASATQQLATAPAPDASKEAAKLAPAAGKPETPVAAKPVKKKSKKAKKAAADDAAFDAAADDYPAYDNDPWEPLNRSIFAFNRVVDSLLLRPVTSVYRGVVPEEGRAAVSRVLDNLYAPVTFANSILQCDVQNTFATFWRFVINSTFGIGGIFDVASEAGLKNRTTDLGQTFGVHGADAGPFIMIPIMGPSNVRDAIGRVGDIFFFPPNYSSEWAVPLAIGAVSAVDARSNNMELIDGVYRSSLDPYATFRSGYMQKRAAEIKKAKESRAASVAKMSNNSAAK